MPYKYKHPTTVPFEGDMDSIPTTVKPGENDGNDQMGVALYIGIGFIIAILAMIIGILIYLIIVYKFIRPMKRQREATGQQMGVELRTVTEEQMAEPELERDNGIEQRIEIDHQYGNEYQRGMKEQQMAKEHKKCLELEQHREMEQRTMREHQHGREQEQRVEHREGIEHQRGTRRDRVKLKSIEHREREEHQETTEQHANEQTTRIEHQHDVIEQQKGKEQRTKRDHLNGIGRQHRKRQQSWNETKTIESPDEPGHANVGYEGDRCDTSEKPMSPITIRDREKTNLTVTRLQSNFEKAPSDVDDGTYEGIIHRDASHRGRITRVRVPKNGATSHSEGISRHAETYSKMASSTTSYGNEIDGFNSHMLEIWDKKLSSYGDENECTHIATPDIVRGNIPTHHDNSHFYDNTDTDTDYSLPSIEKTEHSNYIRAAIVKQSRKSLDDCSRSSTHNNMQRHSEPVKPSYESNSFAYNTNMDNFSDRKFSDTNNEEINKLNDISQSLTFENVNTEKDKIERTIPPAKDEIMSVTIASETVFTVQSKQDKDPTELNELTGNNSAVSVIGNGIESENLYSKWMGYLMKNADKAHIISSPVLPFRTNKKRNSKKVLHPQLTIRNVYDEIETEEDVYYEDIVSPNMVRLDMSEEGDTTYMSIQMDPENNSAEASLTLCDGSRTDGLYGLLLDLWDQKLWSNRQENTSNNALTLTSNLDKKQTDYETTSELFHDTHQSRTSANDDGVCTDASKLCTKLQDENYVPFVPSLMTHGQEDNEVVSRRKAIPRDSGTSSSLFYKAVSDNSSIQNTPEAILNRQRFQSGSESKTKSDYANLLKVRDTKGSGPYEIADDLFLGKQETLTSTKESGPYEIADDLFLGKQETLSSTKESGQYEQYEIEDDSSLHTEETLSSTKRSDPYEQYMNNTNTEETLSSTKGSGPHQTADGLFINKKETLHSAKGSGQCEIPDDLFLNTNNTEEFLSSTKRSGQCEITDSLFNTKETVPFTNESEQYKNMIEASSKTSADIQRPHVPVTTTQEEIEMVSKRQAAPRDSGIDSFYFESNVSYDSDKTQNASEDNLNHLESNASYDSEKTQNASKDNLKHFESNASYDSEKTQNTSKNNLNHLNIQLDSMKSEKESDYVHSLVRQIVSYKNRQSCETGNDVLHDVEGTLGSQASVKTPNTRKLSISVTISQEDNDEVVSFI